jgi:hypothetical protein
MDCNVQEEKGWLLMYHETFMSTTRTRCESSSSYKIQLGVGSLTAERGVWGGEWGGGGGMIKLNLSYII